jgi:hypothetical protein
MHSAAFRKAESDRVIRLALNGDTANSETLA